MGPMYFEWDENKNRQNLLKHDVRFETAALVFDDPHALTQRDQPSDDEERWITLGAVGAGVVLFVVHTWRERSGEEVIRVFRHDPRRRAKGKDMRKLSREQKRDIAAIAAKKEENIDLSEMPEVVDWSGAEIGKFYRPPKKSVTMRLDQDVLEWLKAYGKGYQTKVNLLLRHAMASTGEHPRKRAKRPHRAS